MSGNKLKLNSDKTDSSSIGHEWQRSKYLTMFPVDLLDVKTTSAKSAWNLGVVFDANFSFCSHGSAVCRSCRYHMRDLRHICRYLTFNSAKLLAHMLVSSCLDYCNSPLFGFADKEIIQLQRSQNYLAHVVTKKPPSTHSVPPLCSLHWLPIKFRDRIEDLSADLQGLQWNQPDYF